MSSLGALYLASHALMSMLGIAVVAGRTPRTERPAASPSAPRASATSPTTLRRTNGSALVERITAYDPFCPQCAPEAPIEVAPLPPPPPGIERIDPREVATTLPWTLVATLEAAVPGPSLATISDGRSTGLFAEGDEIVDGVTLLAVAPGVVHLQVGDAIEYLPLDGSARGAVPVRPEPHRPPPESKRKPSRYELDGAREAISCRGNSCTIDRRFVAELLAKPAQLVTQGRATPYSREGLRGFRLSRVRRGTIPRLLGLRSGDVLTAVNGHPLESLDGAMTLYTRLRRASHLRIELVRNERGQRKPMTIDVDIV